VTSQTIDSQGFPVLLPRKSAGTARQQVASLARQATWPLRLAVVRKIGCRRYQWPGASASVMMLVKRAARLSSRCPGRERSRPR